MKAKKIKRKAISTGSSKRVRVSQSDVPTFSLDQAVRVAKALANDFGLRPARPLQVAQSMGVQPTSGPFRAICGSAIAYGLTEGGYNASQIALTQLGRRIVAPTVEGDDALALREAVLRPRIIREFLTRYDGAKFPRHDIACNLLVEMGVPRESTKRVLELVVESAKCVGFLRVINSVAFVDLQGTPQPASASQEPPTEEDTSGNDDVSQVDVATMGVAGAPSHPQTQQNAELKNTRVFISHGKNLQIVSQIKTLLNVSEVEYEIAIEEESLAMPVPEKVLGSMRKCNAALICVTVDEKPTGAFSSEVNQNVLIEIGAAFVLYDKRVILLWDKRLHVPSNLQGLYRCEFQGNELSWTEGMKLMEAIKNFKT